ncbi:MAG: protein-L-isoaspartate O-methyltransferase [Candidatus Omnitrophota bacterium]
MKTVIAIMLAAALLPNVCFADAPDYARERKMMVDTQVMTRGIKDQKILDIIGKTERHKFVPEGMREYAYEDISLPVGDDEAVPPAYFTALIAKMAGLRGDERVLIIGVEAGYQAAVFSGLAREIYCVDVSEKLTAAAEKKLEALGYGNIKIKTGNLQAGWIERAPFHLIIITNPMEYAPKNVIDQVMMNGKVIMPIREFWGKKLIVMTKIPRDKGGYEMVATLVGPAAGEKPLGFPKKESSKDDSSKWTTGKGSKWMKRNK